MRPAILSEPVVFHRKQPLWHDYCSSYPVTMHKNIIGKNNKQIITGGKHACQISKGSHETFRRYLVRNADAIYKCPGIQG